MIKENKTEKRKGDSRQGKSKVIIKLKKGEQHIARGFAPPSKTA